MTQPAPVSEFDDYEVELGLPQLQSLPEEVLVRMASFLPIRDVVALGSTSKRMYMSLLANETLFVTLADRDFGTLHAEQLWLPLRTLYTGEENLDFWDFVDDPTLEQRATGVRDGGDENEGLLNDPSYGTFGDNQDQLQEAPLNSFPPLLTSAAKAFGGVPQSELDKQGMQIDDEVASLLGVMHEGNAEPREVYRELHHRRYEVANQVEERHIEYDTPWNITKRTIHRNLCCYQPYLACLSCISVPAPFYILAFLFMAAAKADGYLDVSWYVVFAPFLFAAESLHFAASFGMAHAIVEYSQEEGAAAAGMQLPPGANPTSVKASMSVFLYSVMAIGVGQLLLLPIFTMLRLEGVIDWPWHLIFVPAYVWTGAYWCLACCAACGMIGDGDYSLAFAPFTAVSSVFTFFLLWGFYLDGMLGDASAWYVVLPLFVGFVATMCCVAAYLTRNPLYAQGDQATLACVVVCGFLPTLITAALLAGKTMGDQAISYTGALVPIAIPTLLYACTVSVTFGMGFGAAINGLNGKRRAWRTHPLGRAANAV